MFKATSSPPCSSATTVTPNPTGIRGTTVARAGLDMGGRPEERRSQQCFVLMLHRHPPLEAGATRAVDSEQEAGTGCGLHVASQNAAALMGLDEPAELVIDAHPLTPSVELYCSIQIQASTGGILFRR
jgi:hypothetical protein